MEVVVAETLVGEPFNGRHMDGPAERAGHAEPHIVDQYDEHIRRVSRSLHFKARRSRRLAGVERGDRRALGFRNRQYRPIQLVRRLRAVVAMAERATTMLQSVEHDHLFRNRSVA